MADSTGDNHKDRPRACAYCNRSKTKCSLSSGPGTGSCQRCTRLKRPCSMPEQNERRRRGPSTRVGQLEEKLDGIMSLLSASQGLQQLATPTLSNSSTPPTFGLPLESLQNPPPPVSRSARYAPRAGSFEVVPGFQVTGDEAERFLNLYRSEYSPKFPFVPISPEVAPDELFQSRPFLFRVIIQIIAPQTAETQREVAQWVRQHVSHHVLVVQERRLELLQGLLLYIGWANHFNFCIDYGGTALFQLLVGMALEAGLGKPGRPRTNTPNHLLDEARRVKGFKARRPHTLEDMRAMLGVFYLNSLATSLFYHMPMCPYSAYLRTCRQAIESTAEFESDRFLSILVQMLHVGCRTHYTFPNPEMDGSEPVEFTGASHMVLTSVKRELEALRKETPPEIRASCMFDLCYKGILVRLYEPVIYMNPTSAFADGAAWRSEALWFCLEAAKSYLVAYLNNPAEQIPYLPCQVFSYFSFTLITVTRLLFLNDSDWNQAEARKAMDFVTLARQLSDHLSRGGQAEAAGARKIRYIEDGYSFLGMSAEKMRWIGSWYLSKQGPADEVQRHQQQPHLPTRG
ncbi:hypothetical protein B0T14DRAFT_232685 [Immersiella caudata]|uniref:Zn(2)-C6 fungal-type domain-containing protein n=1 Tax=Immersiella caudata TaxID=314043 RepID=A0AA39WRY0_9PEZI|nr:hypothetical protein B0T14DRAFT_344462 [Immersiella caudata]KAK0620474.1 hypothetical protein B0T14DRAFT_232685 [Immersiella caudata]